MGLGPNLDLKSRSSGRSQVGRLCPLGGRFGYILSFFFVSGFGARIGEEKSEAKKGVVHCYMEIEEGDLVGVPGMGHTVSLTGTGRVSMKRGAGLNICFGSEIPTKSKTRDEPYLM